MQGQQVKSQQHLLPPRLQHLWLPAAGAEQEAAGGVAGAPPHQLLEQHLHLQPLPPGSVPPGVAEAGARRAQFGMGLEPHLLARQRGHECMAWHGPAHLGLAWAL